MYDPSTQFIVDKLFSRNRLHLIFGPLRTGKSILLQQIMHDWSHGEKVFGFDSYPAHYCFIDALRPLAEIKAQALHLGYDPSQIPIVSLLECAGNEERTMEAVFTHAQRLVPTTRVIFLDGIQSLCHGNIAYQRDVVNFMADTVRTCIRKQITIIATAGTSKAGESATTAAPVMQRITGSTAWGELSGSLVHFGPAAPDNFTAPERRISITMPNHPPIELNYTFSSDDNRLIPLEIQELVPAMDQWLTGQAAGAEFSKQDAVTAGGQLGKRLRTVELWLTQQRDLGTLEKLGQGKYRKRGIQ